LEKHYGEDGLPVSLDPVEQWFWTRKGMFGDWRYLADATSSRNNAVPIERENFLIFETAALNRVLAPLFFRKAMAQKNWDSWLEVFGIPSTFLIGPPGVTPEKEADYLAIAQELISDGRGYLPNGSDIKFVEGSSTGAKPPFQDLCDYLNKQIVLAATGGHLTMLSEQGGGYYAAGAQVDSFAQVAEADAGLLAEVFQRDFDAPILAEFFPGRPVCAYFTFRPAGTRDPSQIVNTALLLAGMGYRIDPAQLSERIGMKIEAVQMPPRNDRGGVDAAGKTKGFNHGLRG
jgi:phage gp29-like protein